MRITPLLLSFHLSLVGCVDSLGIGSSCSAEMTQTRIQYGQPDGFDDDESRGDYYEVWDYYDQEIRFVFRWGSSYDRCQVERTPLRNVMPLPSIRA